VFEDGIFGGESDTAGADDDHDEEVKVTQVHDEMTEPTNTVRTHHIAGSRTRIYFPY